MGNGQTYCSFNIFIPTFLYSVLQTLDEVASIEIIKTHYRSKFLRQDNGGNF